MYPRLHNTGLTLTRKTSGLGDNDWRSSSLHKASLKNKLNRVMPVCGKCKHAHVTAVIGEMYAYQYECGIREHDQSTKCPDRKEINFMREDGTLASILIGSDQVIDMSPAQPEVHPLPEQGDIVQCEETEDVYQFLRGTWVDVSPPYEETSLIPDVPSMPSEQHDAPTFNIDIAGSW